MKYTNFKIGSNKWNKKNLDVGLGISALHMIGVDAHVVYKDYENEGKFFQASTGLHLKDRNKDFGTKIAVGTAGIEARVLGFGLTLGERNSFLTPKDCES